MYTEGGGWGVGVGEDCHVKNFSASSSNDIEHRTWCTGLLFTQYRKEVFHHTNLEHYKTLTSKTKAVKAKMVIKVAN